MKKITLLVDAGNTRIKAALLKNNTLGKTHAFPTLPHFFNFFSKKHFHQSIFSSVLSDKETQILSKKLGNFCETIVPLRALSQGMICSPYDLNQLGEDRLAKLLYARFSQKKPCVLIDAGTALTVDFFSPPNIFLGGFILGGFSLECTALSKKTRKLPQVTPSPKRLSRLPKNTEEAIHQGVLESKALGIRALIEKIEKQEKIAFSHSSILLTGGEAKLLSPYFSNGSLQENLVLQGMQALHQNLFPS
jgi:type III pantothenate kinase